MVKILIFGANGYIGKYVTKRLLQTSYDVIDSNIDGRIDPSDAAQVLQCIIKHQPKFIISCAGIVENSVMAYQNAIFSINILKAATHEAVKVRRIIITGSAAEYGIVSGYNDAVPESYQLNATSDYGKSKIEETKHSLLYAAEHNLDLVIARVFNPIGNEMGKKFLITKILSQIEEIKHSDRKDIEISRLDSYRDYIDVRDVANAFALLLEAEVSQKVYNIGSGRPTSNGQIINALIDAYRISPRPLVRETMSESEPYHASRADISSLQTDTGWSPKYSLEETIKEICS